MALVQPEYLQTKSYSALRDRLMFQHGGPIQPGVWDLNDFRVTQRGAGANMSVDVNSGYALVPANNAGNRGLYHVENDLLMNATVTAAHATLPRIDQVVIDVADSTSGGDASDTPTLLVLAGTATSGATLDNRTGAAALGNNQLRIADILVGGGVTSITTSNIRDRRPWARGAYYRTVDSAGNIALAAGLASVGPNRFRARIEATGNPIRVHFRCNLVVVGTAGVARIFLAPVVNGGFISGDTGSNGDQQQFMAQVAISVTAGVNFSWDLLPTAGSTLIDIYGAQTGSAGTVVATGGTPAVFVIEELVRGASANNGTS